MSGPNHDGSSLDEARERRARKNLVARCQARHHLQPGGVEVANFDGTLGGNRVLGEEHVAAAVRPEYGASFNNERLPRLGTKLGANEKPRLNRKVIVLNRDSHLERTALAVHAVIQDENLALIGIGQAIDMEGGGCSEPDVREVERGHLDDGCHDVGLHELDNV